MWQPRHTTFFQIGFAKKPAQFKYDEKHRQGPNEIAQMEAECFFSLFQSNNVMMHNLLVSLIISIVSQLNSRKCKSKFNGVYQRYHTTTPKLLKVSSNGLLSGLVTMTVQAFNQICIHIVLLYLIHNNHISTTPYCCWSFKWHKLHQNCFPTKPTFGWTVDQTAGTQRKMIFSLSCLRPHIYSI